MSEGLVAGLKGFVVYRVSFLSLVRSSHAALQVSWLNVAFFPLPLEKRLFLRNTLF